MSFYCNSSSVLEEKSKNFASKMFPSGFLMIHNATRGSHDQETTNTNLLNYGKQTYFKQISCLLTQTDGRAWGMMSSVPDSWLQCHIWGWWLHTESRYIKWFLTKLSKSTTTYLVDPSVEVNNNLTSPVVIDDLELSNVSFQCIRKRYNLTATTA